MNQDLDFQTEVIDRLSRIEATVVTLPPRIADHETRVRALEKRQWLLAGAAVALGPILTRLGIHLPTLQ